MDLKRLPFKDALVTTPIYSHLYEVAMALDFCFGNSEHQLLVNEHSTEYRVAAHGGFLVSIIAHAAQQHFETSLKEYNQSHPFNIHVIFLRTVPAGKAEPEVKDSELGSGVSTIHITLNQGGKERVAAYVS